MAKATFDLVVSSMRISSVFVALLSLCISVQAKANFTVWVTRRLSNDLYQFNSAVAHLTCDSRARTYLINEKECALDANILSECSFAITPTRQSSFLIPIVEDIAGQHSAIINTMSSTDFNSYAVSFGFNKTKQPVNSSFCQISSLEVYRGRDQAIEISHQGFSLNGSGSIEIHSNQLAYDTEDYTGELYCMNLSCSGGGLPQSGCLFFKVAGITNTTEDKFNGTVSGTLVHSQPEANLTEPNGSPALTETNMTTTVSVSTMVEPTANVSVFEVGSVLFYAVIGGGIVVLAFSFIIVCVLICYSVQRKGKSQTFTTAARLQAQNVIHTQEFEPSPYESPRPNSSERVDDLTLMSNNGHVYQPTGDTIPSTDNDYRTGQCRYQVQFFPTEVQHNNTIAEENALDHSPESKIKHSPTNSKEDLELSQVYDAVSPKPFVERGATAGMVYDQLTHSGHHGKQSLPTYLGGAPEYSSLSVWQDSPHNKALGESMPVYDAPDVKPVKGRKSYRAMTLPSHKISSCSCPPLPLSKLESRDILDLEHTYAILEQDQSTHDIQVENNRDSEVHTHAILERCQSQLSAACVQTGSTEVDHTYAILEQDQGEGLLSSEGDTCEADDNMEHTYAILEQDHTEGLLSNESDTRDADMEHTYAILEQELPRTLKLAEQEYHTLEETANFRTYTSHDLHSQESRPDQRKLSSSKPRDANFELVQIYNKVTSKPPNAREMDAALTEQRSHQACRKKQSLPSYLGARRTGHSATDVGNTPDLKTKKQRKKKQGNERPSNSEAAMGAAASHHKISTTSCPPVSLFTESEGANVARCNTMDGQYTPGGASHV